MKYVCDPCFDTYFSGSWNDIPGTVLPTIQTPCMACLQLVTPGIELKGHWINDVALQGRVFRPVVQESVSGSL